MRQWGKEADHGPGGGKDRCPACGPTGGNGIPVGCHKPQSKEMDHLADISLLLAFVMKKAACTNSKENKTLKTTTGIVIASSPKTSPDTVGPEQGSGPAVGFTTKGADATN